MAWIWTSWKPYLFRESEEQSWPFLSSPIFFCHVLLTLLSFICSQLRQLKFVLCFSSVKASPPLLPTQFCCDYRVACFTADLMRDWGLPSCSWPPLFWLLGTGLSGLDCSRAHDWRSTKQSTRAFRSSWLLINKSGERLERAPCTCMLNKCLVLFWNGTRPVFST